MQDWSEERGTEMSATRRKFCVVKFRLLVVNRGMLCWTFLKSAYGMASQMINGKVIGNVRQMFGQGFES